MPPIAALAYGPARALLFRLDAEAAHDWTLRALAFGQNTPLQRLWQQPRLEDPVQFAGLEFPNRVGLAAGFDKNARCVAAFDAMGFGFAEFGTVTPLSQAGNARPRLFRLAPHGAVINRFGFNNDGLVRFLDNVAAARHRRIDSPARRPMLLGLNIGKNAATPMDEAARDYGVGLAAVYPVADYVTLNISSPNTAQLRSLQAAAALDALLAPLVQQRRALAQSHRRTVPLFVKVAPDLDDGDIDSIAASLQRHGIDGVIATNTTVARDHVAGHRYAGEAGGLSGRPLADGSNRVIARLRSMLGPQFPIIGVGGVMAGADAVAKRAAGADLVQLYTGLVYRGPVLVPEVAAALRHGS